jgi:hypothetical protein
MYLLSACSDMKCTVCRRASLLCLLLNLKVHWKRVYVFNYEKFYQYLQKLMDNSSDEVADLAKRGSKCTVAFNLEGDRCYGETKVTYNLIH